MPAHYKYTHFHQDNTAGVSSVVQEAFDGTVFWPCRHARTCTRHMRCDKVGLEHLHRVSVLDKTNSSNLASVPRKAHQHNVLTSTIADEIFEFFKYWQLKASYTSSLRPHTLAA
jgi:hypothetical protein